MDRRARPLPVRERDRRAHDDHTHVAGEGLERVLDALAFPLVAGGRITDLVRGDAEDLRGGLEGEERAGRRLREIKHRSFVSQEAFEVHEAFLRLIEPPDRIREDADGIEKGPIELGTG